MGIEALNTLQLAGSGLQAVNAFGQSRATKQSLDAQAQVARNNAQIATWQAEDAIQRGQRSASKQMMKTRQTKGAQRAAMAANGVDLGVGSALQILTDTDYFGEIDANTIKDNAAREAWAIRAQAAGYRADASVLESRSDMESPFAAAGTSFLTSAGKVAGRWYDSKTGGAGAGDDPMTRWRRNGSGGD